MSTYLFRPGAGQGESPKVNYDGNIQSSPKVNYDGNIQSSLKDMTKHLTAQLDSISLPNLSIY